MKLQRIIEAGGRQWQISKHALERALDMQLDGRDIFAALDHPDQITDSIKYPNSKHYRHGDFALSISFDYEIPVICTIVWATQQAWRDDLSHHTYGGRTIRA